MGMDEKALFTKILKIKLPWFVKQLEHTYMDFFRHIGGMHP